MRPRRRRLSATGRIVEVTTDGDIVWEVIHPDVSGEAVAQGTTRETTQTRTGGAGNPVFRSYRYPIAYPAFIGKELMPQGVVEADVR